MARSKVEGQGYRSFSKLLFPVLVLNPMSLSTAAVRSIPALRNNPFKPEVASLSEQVRTDLALFKVAQEDPVDATRQHAREIGLRRCSGNFRMSSPSATSISNA